MGELWPGNMASVEKKHGLLAAEEGRISPHPGQFKDYAMFALEFAQADHFRSDGRVVEKEVPHP